MPLHIIFGFSFFFEVIRWLRISVLRRNNFHTLLPSLLCVRVNVKGTATSRGARCLSCFLNFCSDLLFRATKSWASTRMGSSLNVRVRLRMQSQSIWLDEITIRLVGILESLFFSTEMTLPQINCNQLYCLERIEAAEKSFNGTKKYRFTLVSLG